MHFLGNVFAELTINKKNSFIGIIPKTSTLFIEILNLRAMKYIDYSEKLDKVRLLVEQNAIGTPIELANRINVSEKTTRRMIDHLRQKGEDIKYCRVTQTYILI